jgi:hypothetical protein
MHRRRRFKQSVSARRIRGRSACDGLVSPAERDELLKKARLADTAYHVDEWANSPALQPPT